jgi:hypothetical protein
VCAERQDIMSSSLFLLGEIGINDYNHPLFQNRSFVDEIRPLMPKVIAKIENATKVSRAKQSKAAHRICVLPYLNA